MRTLARLLADQTGAMAIETAFVTPILVVLSLGGVETGSMVARQSELQSAAAEALSIVQAAPPEDTADRTAIKNVLMASTGITNANNVSVVEIWRCGTDAGFERDRASDCGSSAVSTYIEITLRETYTPTWTAFGIGSAMTYNVVRQVQVS
jgi:Flp pilus assembly protein TadG